MSDAPASASLAASVPVRSAKLSAAAVSLRLSAAGAVSTGASLAPPRLTVSVRLSLRLPSDTATVKASLAAAVSAFTAAASAT